LDMQQYPDSNVIIFIPILCTVPLTFKTLELDGFGGMETLDAMSRKADQLIRHWR
jgi:hypothetical protein